MPIKPSPAKAHFVVPCALLAIGLALSAVLVASITSQASSTPTPIGTPAVSNESVASDSILPATDEGRAEFGSIFVGEVIAFAGEEKVPTSDPEDDYRVPLYDVRVEQTLKGNVSGQVRIKYDDPGGLTPDASKIQVGGRYLFFAGYNPDKDWYPVDPVVGVIPIKGDRQAAELAATFEPLIRQAERTADRSIAEDPCESPREQPSITVEPQQGVPGDQVRLIGGPFIRPEAPVSWNGKDEFLMAASVEEDCTIDLEITIPKAKPGQYRVLVYDAGGNTAEATFEVMRK